MRTVAFPIKKIEPVSVSDLGAVGASRISSALVMSLSPVLAALPVLDVPDVACTSCATEDRAAFLTAPPCRILGLDRIQNDQVDLPRDQLVGIAYLCGSQQRRNRQGVRPSTRFYPWLKPDFYTIGALTVQGWCG
jgi:hypothetical protein